MSRMLSSPKIAWMGLPTTGILSWSMKQPRPQAMSRYLNSERILKTCPVRQRQPTYHSNPNRRSTYRSSRSRMCCLNRQRRICSKRRLKLSPNPSSISTWMHYSKQSLSQNPYPRSTHYSQQSLSRNPHPRSMHYSKQSLSRNPYPRSMHYSQQSLSRNRLIRCPISRKRC